MVGVKRRETCAGALVVVASHSVRIMMIKSEREAGDTPSGSASTKTGEWAGIRRPTRAGLVPLLCVLCPLFSDCSPAGAARPLHSEASIACLLILLAPPFPYDESESDESKTQCERSRHPPRARIHFAHVKRELDED